MASDQPTSDQKASDQLASDQLASDRADGPTTSFQMMVRVGYYETDGQRRVHHANYLNYFEQSRVEMLRSVGFDYREFENTGLMLVVTEMNVRYRGAAQFDDLLRVTTTVTEVRGVRIRHHYSIDRDGEVLVDADSTIACVDRSGKVRRLPSQWGWMFAPAGASVSNRGATRNTAKGG